MIISALLMPCRVCYRYVSSLLDSMSILFTSYGLHEFPLTFEDVGQAAGFLLYSTQVK
jgi:hypothetical protein